MASRATLLPPLPVLALLALLVLQGCGSPSQGGDCDRLLGQGRYQRVLEVCGAPFHRASAYLGLAGFSMVDLIGSEQAPGSVVELLGLDADNVTDRRLLLVNAVEEVREPVNGNQAFALLISAYLGLGVTMAEYLDNGAGSAAALDDTVTDGEISSATGLTRNEGVDLQIVTETPPYFQVVPTQGAAEGDTFLVRCDLDTSVTYCNSLPSNSVRAYADSDGAGLLDYAALPSASPQQSDVAEELADADPAGLVVQFLDLDLPVTLNPAKQDRMQNFLGEGEPDAEFTIGVEGFLELIDRGRDGLAIGSEDEVTGGDTINEQVNAILERIDNGGACLEDDDASGAALLNFLYAVYATAPGTVENPDPNVSDYTERNFATQAQREEAEAGGLTVLPDTINPDDYVFNELGVKFLYPLVVPGTGFDVANATPRVDEAATGFQTDFENLPNLAPDAATAGDGRITFIELSCARK